MVRQYDPSPDLKVGSKRFALASAGLPIHPQWNRPCYAALRVVSGWLLYQSAVSSGTSRLRCRRPHCCVAGERLEALALHAMGVRVLSLRRALGQTVVLAEDNTLGGGDTLVLSGRPAGLALAEEKLLK